MGQDRLEVLLSGIQTAFAVVVLALLFGMTIAILVGAFWASPVVGGFLFLIFGPLMLNVIAGLLHIEL